MIRLVPASYRASWQNTSAKPLGLHQGVSVMTVSGRKGWGSVEAFPVQLPAICYVNDLGFAAMKAGFVIERHTHPRGLHWVIRDFASRPRLPLDVRFPPKAT